MVKLSNIFCYKFIVHIVVLQPQSCLNKIGLGCSHFARHYSGNHFCFLFLQLLRCFSSLGLPPLGRLKNQPGSPIRKSPGYRLFAPNRSLSQLITSFIASKSQGIHCTLLMIFTYQFYLRFFLNEKTFYCTYYVFLLLKKEK